MLKKFSLALTISGLGMIMIVSEGSAVNPDLCKEILNQRSQHKLTCLGLVTVCFYGGCSLLCDDKAHAICQQQCGAASPPINACISACNNTKNQNLCEGDCPDAQTIHLPDPPPPRTRDQCAPDLG